MRSHRVPAGEEGGVRLGHARRRQARGTRTHSCHGRRGRCRQSCGSCRAESRRGSAGAAEPSRRAEREEVGARVEAARGRCEGAGGRRRRCRGRQEGRGRESAESCGRGERDEEEEEEGGSDDAPVGSGRLRLAWERKTTGTWHRRVHQRVAGSRRERLDLGVEARRTRATKGRGAVVATAVEVVAQCVRCE